MYLVYKMLKMLSNKLLFFPFVSNKSSLEAENLGKASFFTAHLELVKLSSPKLVPPKPKVRSFQSPPQTS
jgi:hypothetical protein